MNDHDLRGIAADGLWRNNPALVQLLGLCPLLAVTTTVTNAIGLGLATLGVMVGSALSVSLIRRLIDPDLRLPAFVLIIASFTTCAMLLMQAWAFTLYQGIALFVQIIVTNCTILGRAEAFASRRPPGPALVDALAMGTGFLLVLVVLGGVRELLARGTLLAEAELLFGPAAADWTLQVLPADYRGFLLAALPPGAFITMGLLLAARWHLDRFLSRHRPRPAAPDTTRRVRVTGEVA